MGEDDEGSALSRAGSRKSLGGDRVEHAPRVTWRPVMLCGRVWGAGFWAVGLGCWDPMVGFLGWWARRRVSPTLFVGKGKHIRRVARSDSLRFRRVISIIVQVELGLWTVM